MFHSSVPFQCSNPVLHSMHSSPVNLQYITYIYVWETLDCIPVKLLCMHRFKKEALYIQHWVCDIKLHSLCARMKHLHTKAVYEYCIGWKQ